ncbi:hypothetical protein Q8G35_22960 [Peribacillus simplex]|uniref:Uncharacterized protein n=2 Tax=Peribacillus TaxID=2675229 RepID=A0AA90SM43_9BACI|nr:MULTISPECIES: hypothetical protein [Peribacillus]MDP1421159.1 hypothetical protein [Peribacillus simplex]MDP1453926.1 hypothetical protein [Peribacillus frigoritolerans]
MKVDQLHELIQTFSTNEQQIAKEDYAYSLEEVDKGNETSKFL